MTSLIERCAIVALATVLVAPLPTVAQSPVQKSFKRAIDPPPPKAASPAQPSAKAFSNAAKKVDDTAKKTQQEIRKQLDWNKTAPGLPPKAMVPKNATPRQREKILGAEAKAVRDAVADRGSKSRARETFNRFSIRKKQAAGNAFAKASTISRYRKLQSDKKNAMKALLIREKLIARPRSSPNFKVPIHRPQQPVIPIDWEVGQAKGAGLIYRAPGIKGDAGAIRVMRPTREYRNGYWVRHNSSGQLVDPDNRTGAKHTTHMPLPYGYWKKEMRKYLGTTKEDYVSAAKN